MKTVAFGGQFACGKDTAADYLLEVLNREKIKLRKKILRRQAERAIAKRMQSITSRKIIKGSMKIL